MQHKKRLLEQLIFALECNYNTAISAAQRAHSTATDKANVAENKYDTLGLEAAYLAEGYANRAAECKANVNAAKNLVAVEYTSDDAICVGALVGLVDQDEKPLSLFLAPVSGGVKFMFGEQNIIVITQSSPIGDDEFEIGDGLRKKCYLINAVA